jgi:phospholipid/cholesterol/gamma-HCH transport system substrate-binding protein
VGGPVYYLGVNVGRVADMKLVPGQHVKVQVDIDVKAKTPIDSGSTASLNAQGITGVTVINISGKPGEHGPLKPTEGFKYPLIPVKQTGLSAMLADAPHVIIKMNRLLDQANELLGEENRKSITQMLHHIDSLTAALDGERDEIAALPLELRTLLQESRSAVAEVKSLVQNIQPDAREVLSNLNAATANMESLSKQLDELLANNQVEIDHFIDNGLGQVPELIYDVRTTLRDMQKLLKQLQADPSQLILRSPDDALKVKP